LFGQYEQTKRRDCALQKGNCVEVYQKAFAFDYREFFFLNNPADVLADLTLPSFIPIQIDRIDRIGVLPSFE
jgi:hypothetical protein